MPDSEEEGECCGLDLDDLLAYDTIKEVKVLDRRLGLVYYGVLIMVIFYIVIYCFIIQKQYLAAEKTDGFMMTKVVTPSFAKLASGGEYNLPFDVFESFSNPGESGALFVPTRLLVTRGQSQSGDCAQPTYPCSSDKDCDTGEEIAKAKCEDGACVRRGWCPAEKPGDPVTEEFKIDGLLYKVWFQGKVQYHKFTDPYSGAPLDAGNIEETVMVHYPGDGANTYAMHDVLEKAGVVLKDVEQEGAVLLVTTEFDCDLDAAEEDQCQTNIMGAMVDGQNGYNYKTVHYYDDGGDRKRDVYHFYGLRLVIFSMGLGQRTDITQVVLVISQAIALLSCAGTAADVFLQYGVPERKHYIEQKIKQTEDFGDNDK